MTDIICDSSSDSDLDTNIHVVDSKTDTNYNEIFIRIKILSEQLENLKINTRLPSDFNFLTQSKIIHSQNTTLITNVKCYLSRIIRYYTKYLKLNNDNTILIKQLLMNLIRLDFKIKSDFQTDKKSCPHAGYIVRYTKNKSNVYYKPVIHIQNDIDNNSISTNGAIFKIIKIFDKYFVLKPLIDFVNRDRNLLPVVINYCGIDLSQSQIAERNIASKKIARLLGVDKLIPEYQVIMYDSKLYLGSELINGVQLCHIKTKSRIKLYQKSKIIKDLFTLQLIDSLVGNIDANSTNIIIKSNNNNFDEVIGIDYDLSWGVNITNIDENTSVIDNTNIPIYYQNRTIHYFKGIPMYIDRLILNKINRINDVDMWLISTVFGNDKISNSHMIRWEKFKKLVNLVEIVDDWNQIALNINNILNNFKKYTYLY